MRLTKLHLFWRSSIYKDKKYKSYSLARAYRIDGKNRREIVLPLGKLTDEEVEKWRMFLKAIKKPNSFITTFDDINVTKKFEYLNLAVIKEIWEEWRLDEPFVRAKNSLIDLSTIAQLLTMNRCLNPSSNYKVCEWVNTTWFSRMHNINNDQINTSRIFRELSEIENNKASICKHLHQQLRNRYPESMNKVFYDLSSATFSGTKCILMEWGHCKEGYRNHVVLALVVNQDGLPFYWEVLEGNTADSKTVVSLLRNLKQNFPKLDTTLVFDRGMVSEKNLKKIDSSKYKYISAMDKNQIENYTSLDFKQYSYFDVERIEHQIEECKEFTRLNETTYYREIGIINKRRYILCFNPQLFKDQRKSRETSLESFTKFVTKLNEDLTFAKKTRDRNSTQRKFYKQIAKLKLKGFISVSLKEINITNSNEKDNDKKVVSYQGVIDPINDGKRIEVEKLDGFWLLVTNHFEREGLEFKLSSAKAIKPYRDKVIIESSFRDIKSFIQVSPFYVWKEKHVKAHFTICVIAHLINRLITMKLHKYGGNITKNIITHEKLYEVFSDYTVNKIQIKNMNISEYKLTQIDKTAEELLERLNLKKILKKAIQQ